MKSLTILTPLPCSGVTISHRISLSAVVACDCLALSGDHSLRERGGFLHFMCLLEQRSLREQDDYARENRSQTDRNEHRGRALVGLLQRPRDDGSKDRSD